MNYVFIAQFSLFLLLVQQFGITGLVRATSGTSGAHSSYIIAECDGGLANRLRALLAYVFIADSVHNDAELFMVWDVNTACPGHFLQIFQPIPRVTFIGSDARAVLRINATAEYRNSRDDFWVTIIKAVNVSGISDKRAGFYKHHQERLFKLLKPLKEIQYKIEEYVKANQICSAISMHIRRTDLWAELFHKHRTAYTAYFRFVENFPDETKVFLMTDNPMTQQLFVEKYGRKKLLVYDDITTNSSIPKIGDRATVGYPKLDENASITTEFRYTSIERTLIDTLIAAHAKDFRRSPASTLSELVMSFQWQNRRRWCKYCIDDGSC